MKASERRQEIFEILCDQRHATMDDLANQFNVSRRTIITDIRELSLIYPIYTVCGKYDGGVYLSDNFKLGKKDYLTPEQEEVLNQLSSLSTFEQREVLQSILKKFGRRSY
ncbi:MAG: HTH domain-containing protein [Cyanobacteria bacterium SIG30]|nr:HTH domain-containing protein [Cyanobacteria bacterium SIG30]